jgi:hypothetical protein
MSTRLNRIIAGILVLSLAVEPLGAVGAAFRPTAAQPPAPADRAFQQQALIAAMSAAFRYPSSFNIRKSLDVIRQATRLWRAVFVAPAIRDASGLLPALPVALDPRGMMSEDRASGSGGIDRSMRSQTIELRASAVLELDPPASPAGPRTAFVLYLLDTRDQTTGDYLQLMAPRSLVGIEVSGVFLVTRKTSPHNPEVPYAVVYTDSNAPDRMIYYIAQFEQDAVAYERFVNAVLVHENPRVEFRPFHLSNIMSAELLSHPTKTAMHTPLVVRFVARGSSVAPGSSLHSVVPLAPLFLAIPALGLGSYLLYRHFGGRLPAEAMRPGSFPGPTKGASLAEDAADSLIDAALFRLLPFGLTGTTLLTFDPASPTAIRAIAYLIPALLINSFTIGRNIYQKQNVALLWLGGNVVMAYLAGTLILPAHPHLAGFALSAAAQLFWTRLTRRPIPPPPGAGGGISGRRDDRRYRDSLRGRHPWQPGKLRTLFPHFQSRGDQPRFHSDGPIAPARRSEQPYHIFAELEEELWDKPVFDVLRNEDALPSDIMEWVQGGMTVRKVYDRLVELGSVERYRVEGALLAKTKLNAVTLAAQGARVGGIPPFVAEDLRNSTHRYRRILPQDEFVREIFFHGSLTAGAYYIEREGDDLLIKVETDSGPSAENRARRERLAQLAEAEAAEARAKAALETRREFVSAAEGELAATANKMLIVQTVLETAKARLAAADANYQSARERAEKIRDELNRGYSGLANEIYTTAIRSLLDSGSFVAFRVKNGRFIPTSFTPENSAQPVGRAVTAEERDVLDRLQFDAETLQIAEGSTVFFMDGLDHAVAGTLQLNGKPLPADGVYGSHYGMSRHQYYFDAQLLQRSSSAALPVHFRHEAVERDGIQKGLNSSEAHAYLKAIEFLEQIEAQGLVAWAETVADNIVRSLIDGELRAWANYDMEATTAMAPYRNLREGVDIESLLLGELDEQNEAIRKSALKQARQRAPAGALIDDRILTSINGPLFALKRVSVPLNLLTAARNLAHGLVGLMIRDLSAQAPTTRPANGAAPNKPGETRHRGRRFFPQDEGFMPGELRFTRHMSDAPLASSDPLSNPASWAAIERVASDLSPLTSPTPNAFGVQIDIGPDPTEIDARIEGRYVRILRGVKIIPEEFLLFVIREQQMPVNIRRAYLPLARAAGVRWLELQDGTPVDWDVWEEVPGDSNLWRPGYPDWIRMKDTPRRRARLDRPTLKYIVEEPAGDSSLIVLAKKDLFGKTLLGLAIVAGSAAGLHAFGLLPMLWILPVLGMIFGPESVPLMARLGFRGITAESVAARIPAEKGVKRPFLRPTYQLVRDAPGAQLFILFLESLSAGDDTLRKLARGGWIYDLFAVDRVGFIARIRIERNTALPPTDADIYFRLTEAGYFPVANHTIPWGPQGPVQIGHLNFTYLIEHARLGDTIEFKPQGAAGQTKFAEDYPVVRRLLEINGFERITTELHRFLFMKVPAGYRKPKKPGTSTVSMFGAGQWGTFWRLLGGPYFFPDDGPNAPASGGPSSDPGPHSPVTLSTDHEAFIELLEYVVEVMKFEGESSSVNSLITELSALSWDRTPINHLFAIVDKNTPEPLRSTKTFQERFQRARRESFEFEIVWALDTFLTPRLEDRLRRDHLDEGDLVNFVTHSIENNIDLPPLGQEMPATLVGELFNRFRGKDDFVSFLNAIRANKTQPPPPVDLTKDDQDETDELSRYLLDQIEARIAGEESSEAEQRRVNREVLQALKSDAVQEVREMTQKQHVSYHWSAALKDYISGDDKSGTFTVSAFGAGQFGTSWRLMKKHPVYALSYGTAVVATILFPNWVSVTLVTFPAMALSILLAGDWDMRRMTGVRTLPARWQAVFTYHIWRFAVPEELLSEIRMESAYPIVREIEPDLSLFLNIAASAALANPMGILRSREPLERLSAWVETHHERIPYQFLHLLNGKTDLREFLFDLPQDPRLKEIQQLIKDVFTHPDIIDVESPLDGPSAGGGGRNHLGRIYDITVLLNPFWYLSMFGAATVVLREIVTSPREKSSPANRTDRSIMTAA